jgi:hypothetical protein
MAKSISYCCIYPLTSMCREQGEGERKKGREGEGERERGGEGERERGREGEGRKDED